MPVAPIHSGLDGGINKVFFAQFPWIIVPLAKVLPDGLQLPQLPAIPYADNDGSVASRLFGSVFGWEAPSQTQTFPPNRSTLESRPKEAPATQIETVAAKPSSTKPSTNEAAQNDLPKTEGQ